MGHETELDMRPLVLKRFIWDIFPHDADIVREVQGRLGLVPDGDDGMTIEHDASDTRINRASPLSGTLETLSEYAAEVMGHYLVAMVQAHHDDEVEVPDDFYEGFARQNTEVVYNSAYAIIAHLLDTGVLTYGEKLRKAAGDGGE